MAKKQTDNEIIDELVAAATPAPELDTLPEQVVDEIVAAPVIEIEVPKAAPTPKKEVTKEPGMYHNGRKIEAVPARVGSKWTVIIDGEKQKVLKSEIEFVD